MFRHRLAVAGVGISCALALAACGSSGSTPVGHTNPALKFAQCMRVHGVPNFPDPTPGRGFAIGPGAGTDPHSPAFRAAQRSCVKLLPGKGGIPNMSASERAAALRFAECMRAHGVSGFPDPALRAPSGVAHVLVVRGMVFALTSEVDPESPAFRQAAPRCGIKPPPVSATKGQ